jgi:hypothetical protein
MTPDSENFDQLRRLLALKRHEMPPPGYFHGFSREVIVRIKAGDMGGEVGSTWWILEGSWLRRVWSIFEARPVLAGGFGVAVCGFFVAGALISADNPQVGSVGLPLPQTLPHGESVAIAPAVGVTPLERVAQELPSSLGAPVSAIPVRDSLFSQLQQVARPSLINFQTAQPVGGN